MINLIKEFLNLGYFTSELDCFLAEFDQAHPNLSASQRKEMAKFARIYKLRDNPNQPQAKPTFWDKF